MRKAVNDCGHVLKSTTLTVAEAVMTLKAQSGTVILIHLAPEEEQNTTPPNMPLWHGDYSELKATEKQQI